jgi:hypothetical protein
MLSPKSARDTLAVLRKVPVVAPESAGNDWQGVQHGELLDTLLQIADRRGLKPNTPAAHLSRAGADLAAGVTFGAPRRNGWLPAIGLKVSNAKRQQLRFYVGGYVPERAAAFAWDSFLSPKRYVTGMDLAGSLEESLDCWEELSRGRSLAVDNLRQTRLTPVESNHLLLEAGRMKLMPGSRVFRVDETYRAAGSRTAWELVLAFGQVAAMNPPDEQLDQVLGFWRLAAAPAAEPVVA